VKPSGVMPYQVGRRPNAKVERQRTSVIDTVIVGGEVRGPDWGVGEAARQFAALREEYERIPRGKHVERELRAVLVSFKGRQGPDDTIA
jgi:hypothetical protein